VYIKSEVKVVPVLN